MPPVERVMLRTRELLQLHFDFYGRDADLLDGEVPEIDADLQSLLPRALVKVSARCSGEQMARARAFVSALAAACLAAGAEVAWEAPLELAAPIQPEERPDAPGDDPMDAVVRYVEAHPPRGLAAGDVIEAARRMVERDGGGQDGG